MMAAMTEQEKEQWRREIIVRFARLSRSGSPTLCLASGDELSGRRPRAGGWGNDGKVIFDDGIAAADCAVALEATGSARQRPYRCRRSKHGHWHLTSKQSRRS